MVDWLDDGHRRCVSPNKSKRLAGYEHPSLIVIHYDASPDSERTIRWMCDPRSKASYHFVISRGGGITQLVELSKAAWHAGGSEWQGDVSVNNMSIGICYSNMGPLKDDGSWEPYPDTQIRAGAALVKRLTEVMPSIRDIVGHSDVAPGRKLDPGPAFPWQRFRHLI